MLKIILYLTALAHAVAAAWMISSPAHFYETVPIVNAVGPYNFHFIIDVGLVYAACAALMAYGAWRGAPLLALAGALWPALHGVFHIIMIFVMNTTSPLMLAWEFVTVIGPAAAGLWAALAFLRAEKTSVGSGITA